MKKIGAFVGKFYPPHMGHIDAVQKALKYCDVVYVIISKNEERNNNIYDDYGFPILSASQIKNWLEKYFQDNKKVKVEIFDESGLRTYPQDRDIWAKNFKQKFPDVNVKIADIGYKEYNEKYFPEYEFFEVDREITPIHSTLIRSNYEKYKEYVLPTAVNDLDFLILNRRKNENKI